MIQVRRSRFGRLAGTIERNHRRWIMEKQLLTVRETAEILNISDGTIYNRMSRDSKNPWPIKPVRIGRSVRFRKADVDKMMKRGEPWK